MTLLRSILLAALVAGTLAGVLVTGLQAVRLVPLILTAEHYEQHGAADAHAHDAAGAEAPEGEAGWSPETPVQRTLATALANLLTAIGFGLLLAAALALSGGADWHRGLLWGLGGYACSCWRPRSACRRAFRARPKRRSGRGSCGGSVPWRRPESGSGC